MLDHIESEQLELELTEDAHRIVYAHDLAGNITFLNKAGELIFGYSAWEARQMNIAQMLLPDFIGQLHKQIAYVLSGRIGLVFEIDVIAKDGRRVALEVSIEAVRRDGPAVEIRGLAVPSLPRRLTRPLRAHEDFVTFSL